MKRLGKWIVPGLALLIPVSLLPALASDGGDQKPPAVRQREAPQTDVQRAEIERAKQKAELIQDGQLNLRDATALAEKQVKGPALEVLCVIETRPETPSPEAMRRGGPSVDDQDKTTGKRLVYRISCFADNKLQTVYVDGLTKKVMPEPEKPQAHEAAPRKELPQRG